MLSFLGKLKKKKNIIKLGGLIVFLLLAFNGFKGGFFLAKAFSNTINILPGEYRLEQNEDAFLWENVSQAFIQDLFIRSDSSEFTELNSAYISLLPLKDNLATTTESILGDDTEIATGTDESFRSDIDATSTIINNNIDVNVASSDDDILNEDAGSVLGVSEEGDLKLKLLEDKASSSNNTIIENIIENTSLEESGDDLNLDTETIYLDEDNSETDDSIEENTEAEKQETTDDDVEAEDIEVPLEKEEDTLKIDENTSEEESTDTEDVVSWIGERVKIVASYFDLKEAFAEKKEDSKKYKKNKNLQSLIFSDFTVPVDYKNSDIGDIIINLSLSALSEYDDAWLFIDYRINGEWENLDNINISNNEISNAINGAYLDYNLSNEVLWDDIDDLELRISYYSPEEFKENKDVRVFLDAIWLEVNYNEKTEKEKKIIEDAERKSTETKEKDIFIENIEANHFFEINDNPEFRFKYKRKEKNIIKKIKSGIVGVFKDGYKDIKIKSNLELPGHKKSEDIETEISYLNNGEFELKLINKNKRSFIPGRYTLELELEDDGEVYLMTQNFDWGVLALNSNKSFYLPGEIAYLQMGVLDDKGHTVCDADLFLEITDPQGVVLDFNTDNKLLARNPECGPDNVIDNPDYYTFYSLTGLGEYKLHLKAVTENGVWEIDDKIEVREELPFEVERIGPTRIYPKANYEMVFKIKANKDYQGEFIEIVPRNFKIINENGIFTRLSDDSRELSWTVDWQEGQTYQYSYIFDAPNRSPEFYLLGPARAGDFAENRQWQIANDAPAVRAKTVIFEAGNYTGDGTTGQDSDTNQTFSAFNFSLAETGVDIKNAFIIFETQFEAYNATGGNYTGYKLGFDTCAGSSCTSAFGTGAGQVLDNNSNILAYDETESNQIRLLLDVTSETQLAAYTGGGAQMEAQVGYHIKNGSTKDAISNAKAVLVLTYTFDKDSENLTNTVSYPLDSTNGTDSGSRQASQGSCTRDSTCPKFSYDMTIPEWSGVATTTLRLSQWFRMYGANDGNNTTDIDPDINIEYGGVTTNPNSSAFHHESVNGGTQGNFPAMYFDEWTNSGYRENVTQEAELFVNAGTNYALGGEVFETYVSSSSASVKTRTVAFPVGIINNGNTTSLTSGSVDVFFPENGDVTGRVDVKSAWLRLIPHHYNSGAESITVSTKTENNATSSDFVYAYNGGGSVIKPAFTIVHIIPSTDYAELEKANATTSKTIKVNTTYSEVEYGGISAELMITYTYTDDSNGYLTNIELFGGQSSASPTISASLTTANSVLPENSGKTILGASLFSSFLNSDSDGAVGAGTVFLYDSDMSTGTPTCTNAFEVEPDDINNYAEFYNDVTSAMDTTDNQSYNTCYSVDESLVSTDGAKMGGVLSYIYAWNNTAPTSTLLTLKQKTDDSGTVDISILLDDNEGDDLRAKLEFSTGTACIFSPSGDPSLDETDSNITATYLDPNIENDNEYQIGTVDSYVHTASGTNTVYFDWLAESDLGEQEGIYCLRLTANDLSVDQENFSTSTVYIDTVSPSLPGSLSLYSRTGTELILNFGATSTEANFREYKIFYKVYDGSDVDEGDSVISSTTDMDLADILFNDAATTSIDGLTASTTYSVSVWAYDDYGNKASSSRVDITTNDAPTGIFNISQVAQKTDGSGRVDISIEVDDLNNHDTLKAKIEYSTSTNCSFVSKGDPTLDENSNNVLADFGLPIVENDNEYQVGASGAWILTSPGSNTVDFDWFGRLNEPTADAEHCLRLTMNDRFDNQLVLATTSLTLDNVSPTAPGILQAGVVTTDSITLWYASTTPSIDTNEPTTNAYKIFYKQAVSGVTMSDIEIDNTDLNAYDYNSATSVILSSLDENTWYVFNIWSFDQYGNIATATEVAIKTNATVSNDSFSFVNSQTDGFDTNIAVGGSDEWTFRAVVSETNGWQVIASTTISLANKNDDVSSFDDLIFSWSQTGDIFSEVGTDLNNMATISENSSSTCAVNTCTLDFKIVFNKTFASTSKDYAVKISTGNDIDVIDSEIYTDFYQVRFPYVEQKHYRFRRDDGGE